MFVLALKKVQMVKITPPQIAAAQEKIFPSKISDSTYPVTLFGEPCLLKEGRGENSMH